MSKRVLVSLAAMALAALGLSSVSPGADAAPGTSPAGQLTCFVGGIEYGATDDGTCVRKGSTFTLSHDEENKDYAGVEVANQNLDGQLVRNLGLTFTYSGDAGGGSPRFSIALQGGGYVFVDTACDANGDGVVNIQEPGCIISDNLGYYGLASDYEGVAGTGGAQIVSDGLAQTTVISNIQLLRTPPGKKK